jgi:LPXTG-site transpeptidase (sortase) family protein
MTEVAKTGNAMRVVIGCDTFPPDINGASRFAERLAAGLVRAGHEVHIITPAYSKKFGTFNEVHDSSSMTVHRIKSYRVVQHKTLRYVWPFTLKAKTDRLLRQINPQAVHINSHMIVGRYLMKSAKEQGIRVIATNHIMPENLIKYSLVIPRWAEKIAMNLAWKDAGRVLRKADVVTTPTRKAATLLETASGLTGVLAVSCGIEAARFANDSPTSNKEPRILFLGRLDYEKHIHNLLKAVALLPEHLEVKLEIVGDGGEREYLEALAKDLGIAKNVEFRGHITDEELPKVYERATVFAMPSIAELQSIATMEAMASGRPVVAADAMALPHLVHDADNGYLFPPDDVKAFADRLLRVLIADQSELDRLSENSLHLIQSHDIKRTIGIFEGLYRGDDLEENETADNLDTYSLPIGTLSKTLSRSLALTRRRSAKIRARAENARDRFLARAETAGQEVRGRLEGVRNEVSFAAMRFELRVRKGVRKAAHRLRYEELRNHEITVRKASGNSEEHNEPLPSETSHDSTKNQFAIVNRALWKVIRVVRSAGERLASWLREIYERGAASLRSSLSDIHSAIRAAPAKCASKKLGIRVRLAQQRLISLKRRQSQLRKRIFKAAKSLRLLTEPSTFEQLAKQQTGVSFRIWIRKALKSRVMDDVLITLGAIIAMFVVWFLFINDSVQGSRQAESARSLVQEWRRDTGSTVIESIAVAPSLDLPPVVRPPALSESFATLYVPRFGSDFVRVIAEGTDETAVLNSRTRGVGRYTESDPLGSVGNFAIAGHRTTWGAAFGEIGELRLGDKIYVEIPEGWFMFSFRNTEYVWETEVDVLNPIPQSSETPIDTRMITLTSCHPKFSEAERIVAYGVFEGWYPRDAGAPEELVEIFNLTK